MTTLRLRDRTVTIEPGRPLVMGIVNANPDSFSDVVRAATLEGQVEHALSLVADGADLIDIGGESTRPGAQPVLPDQQIERVVSVIEAIRSQQDICLSIDTQSATVASAALHAGASIVNDISAGVADAAMF